MTSASPWEWTMRHGGARRVPPLRCRFPRQAAVKAVAAAAHPSARRHHKALHGLGLKMTSAREAAAAAAVNAGASAAQVVARFDGHVPRPIMAIAASPDDACIVTGNGGGEVFLWARA